MELTESLKMQERARRFIPGMTQLLSKRPDMFSEGVWPGYYEKAEGVHVWDLDGNRYIDMSISGIGANVLGYADPDVNRAVMRAVSGGSSCSLNCPEDVELAELLCRIHPWAKMVRFARCGGEAMAIAVRVARAATGREIVAFCGYHGWHDWYLAANLAKADVLGGHLLSGLDPRGVPGGLAGTALPFHYNRLDELEGIAKRIGKELAAIVMEPIRSSEPIPGFLEGVRDIADSTGAVLVMDEISAGFRMNTGGAHLLLKLQPDMAVFSKALGNGYPIAAIIGRRSVMEAVQTTFISSTMWTERVGPAASLAMIRKHLELDAGTHLMHIGKMVQDGWGECARRHHLDIQVGGIPPLAHFIFRHEAMDSLKAYFIQLMLAEGFLASNLFYAMLAHRKKHVTQYLEAVDRSFARLAEALDSGNLSGRLQGKASSNGFKRLS